MRKCKQHQWSTDKKNSTHQNFIVLPSIGAGANTCSQQRIFSKSSTETFYTAFTNLEVALKAGDIVRGTLFLFLAVSAWIYLLDSLVSEYSVNARLDPDNAQGSQWPATQFIVFETRITNISKRQCCLTSISLVPVRNTSACLSCHLFSYYIHSLLAMHSLDPYFR